MNLLERLKKIREEEKKKAEAEKFPANETMYAIPIGEQEELNLKPKKKSIREQQKSETQPKQVPVPEEPKSTVPSESIPDITEELENPPITQHFSVDDKDDFLIDLDEHPIQTSEFSVSPQLEEPITQPESALQTESFIITDPDLLAVEESTAVSEEDFETQQTEKSTLQEEPITQTKESIVQTESFIITNPELLAIEESDSVSEEVSETHKMETPILQEEPITQTKESIVQTESFIITSPELLAVDESTTVKQEDSESTKNQKSEPKIPSKNSESSSTITENKKESKVIEFPKNQSQETPQSSDFGNIKSKPKYSIQFKMMLVISLILGIAVSTIIFLATLFFKIDNKRAVETNTFELVRVLELKVRADLNSVVEKGKQLAITLNQSFKNPKQKDFLIDQFFKNDHDFIFLGVYSKEGNELKEVQTVFNKNYMEKVSMEEADVLSVIGKNKPSFILSFNGASVLFNASIGLEEPTICISIPPVQEINDKYVLVIMFKLEKILDAFNKSGISETFMVSGDGIVVAHSNPEYVKSAKNLSDNPIVRRLLSDPQPNYQTSYTDSNGRKFLGSYQKVKLGFSNLGVISVVPEDKAFEGVYAIQERNIYIMIISLCLSLIIVFLFAKSISTPVLSLLSETVKIAQGDFKVSLKRTTNDEVGVLTEYFTSMAKGLEEREKVKSILGSMIDPVVVEEAMKDLLSLKRGSEKVITSFFSDVAGFSTISEQLTSVQLASLLNEYLSAMTLILQKHGGVLDKYIGDAIVGIFGAPVDVEEHYLKACRASVEMIAKLDELKKYWVENNLYSKEAQEMDVRIGSNMGPAKVGFMGTDSMGSYTMMGDTVNLAARLEAARKDYGVNILISEMVNEKVTHEMFTRELDKVRVKGKNEPVTLYELIGKIQNVPENIRQSTKLYEEAFKHYLQKEWQKAIELLDESLRIRGKKDKAVNLLKERCESYLLNPPDQTWDGVYTRTHK